MLIEYTALNISKRQDEELKRKLEQPYRINLKDIKAFWELRKLRLQKDHFPKQGA